MASPRTPCRLTVPAELQSDFMKLTEVISIVEGDLLSSKTDPDIEIKCVAAADLMSDVLAFAEPGSVLLTGLCNPQAVRTAEMADIVAIVFVRGKIPPQETIELAEEKGIPLVATSYTMFEMSGRLYQAGMRGCDISCRL
jgi:predicted transcriptional regulator